MEYINCVICNSDNYEILHKVDVSSKSLRYYIFSKNILDKSLVREYYIVKCKKCQLIYTNPRLESKDFILLYSSNKAIGGNWKTFKYIFDFNQDDNIQIANRINSKYNFQDIEWRMRILNNITNSLAKDKVSLLDVGCGDGKFVEFCRQNKFESMGYDINPERILMAENYGNNNVFIFPSKHFSEKKFNIITAWDVIEHTSNPIEFLEEVKSKLEDDGFLVLLTLNIESFFYKLLGKNWYYIDPIQHTFYFSKKTMTDVLNKVGLEIVKIEGDYTHDRTFLNLVRKGFRSLYYNLINTVYFKLFTNDILYKFFGRFILKYKKTSRERVLLRLQNLYPYIFAENYNDNLVYIIRKKK